MSLRDRLDSRPFHNVAVRDNRLEIEPTECIRLTERLLALLHGQWKANHSEQCTNEWPHKGECAWPPPAELEFYWPLAGVSQ
jgi:hypothetical protein